MKSWTNDKISKTWINQTLLDFCYYLKLM